MVGRLEDLRRVVDVNRAIQRRMHDEQGAPQGADALRLIVPPRSSVNEKEQ